MVLEMNEVLFFTEITKDIEKELFSFFAQYKVFLFFGVVRDNVWKGIITTLSVDVHEHGRTFFAVNGVHGTRGREDLVITFWLCDKSLSTIGNLGDLVECTETV